MGLCLSLGRAAAAPYRRGRARRKAHAARAPTPSRSRHSRAALPPADGVAVQLGFDSGFAERYELGRELGRGQFARVHAARSRSGDDVAVKVIPKELLRDEHLADDIRREVRCQPRGTRGRRGAQSASHETLITRALPCQVSILKALAGRPHVVRLLGVYEDEEAVQIVMECVAHAYARCQACGA
jgi:serine/threonine protein kinase